MSGRWRRTRALRTADAAAVVVPASTQPATERHSQPSSQALEDLLGEMRELRLTLAADLSAVAGAAEMGAETVASDIVDADRRELADFVRRTQARMHGARPRALDLAPVPVPVTTVTAAPRWRKRALVAMPAVPLVGALAMSAAAAAGLLPLPTHPSSRHVHVLTAPASPVRSFQNFETLLAGDPSASQVVAAARAFHQQIAELIATAPQTPGGVNEVAQLLQLEQALLLRKQPPGSSVVLAQSKRLAAQLLAVASHRPGTTRPSPAAVPSTPPSSPQPQWSPSSKPTSTKVSSPSPQPPHSTSPTPTASPSSSSPTPHLPTIGN